MATEKNISLTKTVNHVVEGWSGKPKGLYHEYWLLGHIGMNDKGEYDKSTARSSLYSKNGTKKNDRDTNGVLTEHGKKYCLSYIRSNCSDFINEKSEIEFLLDELSQMDSTKNTYKIIFSPKYHCELSGEGIEYTWGFMKRKFRGLPLKDWKTADEFRVSVKAVF